MSSNLPPGVHESDIPGNRPEDVIADRYYERYGKELDKAKVADAIYSAIENEAGGFRQFAASADLRIGILKLLAVIDGCDLVDLAADLGECGVEPLADWLAPGEPDPDEARDRARDARE